MVLLKIAFRNIWRNGRRSLMTAAAIAIGAVALILFGEYQGMAVEGLETGYVQDLGHLTVYRQGYFAFGSGQPERYSIADYDALIALITRDPELKPLLHVVTPTVALGGIEILLETRLTSTVEGNVVLSDGTTMLSDTVVWTAGPIG